MDDGEGKETKVGSLNNLLSIVHTFKEGVLFVVTIGKRLFSDPTFVPPSTPTSISSYEILTIGE